MAELQTTYSNTIAKGYAGMVADGETSNRISRTCEDAAGMAFGIPVYRGTGDHGCVAAVGTLATFLGWTIAVAGQGLVAGQTADTYAQYDNVPILVLGAIYIAVKGAVNDGDAITVGKAGGVADLYGATAADATHIATGWVADETVTDGICRIVRR
jgi:hypothetical protein